MKTSMYNKAGLLLFALLLTACTTPPKGIEPISGFEG